MKKIILLLALSVVLVGCSDAYVSVNEPKDDVLTVGDVSFSKEQMFNLMKSQDPATLVIEMAKRKIMDDKFPINDEVRDKAQEELDYVKEVFGESFLSSISMYGFTTEEEYLEKALIPNAQETLMTEKFIQENMDLITATYAPKKVRIIEFTDADNAFDALEAIRNGENVEEVADQYSTSTAYDGTLKLAHTESAYPTQVMDFISESAVPTLTADPIEVESTGKYFVVQIVEVAPSRFQDEVVEELSQINSVIQMMFVNYFIEGGFDVYDKAIYDGVMQSYQDYLPNR